MRALEAASRGDGLWLNCESSLKTTDADIKWLVARGYVEIWRDRPGAHSRKTKGKATAKGLAALARRRF
jgi:hypothetical protein